MWARVCLEAKEAELAPLLTLSLSDLRLRTHIPNVWFWQSHPPALFASPSLLMTSVNSQGNWGPALMENLSANFVLGDVLYLQRYWTSHTDRLAMAAAL